MELETAIKKPHGYSILIKGKAGTGKTTLALELLSRAKDCMYFSTRISPTSLESQFPWIKKTIEQNCILDVTQLPFSIMDSKDYFESIVKFKDLPEFLQVIYHKTSEMDSPFVVIDAWDTLIKYYGSASSLGKMESFLSEMVRQKDIKLFMVTETDGESYLDYIVDGIITLKRVSFGQRLRAKRIREMHIEKLRGVAINQHEYLFTLNNGRFHYFEPTYPKIKKGTFEKVNDSEEYFSTGNLQLDELLGGGYKKGSFIVFEIEDAISNIFPMTLAFQTVLNFLKNERACSIVPSGGEHAVKYFKELIPFISKEIINDKVFIFVEQQEFSQVGKSFIKIVTGKDIAKDFKSFRESILELKKKSSDNHILQLFTSLASLERRYPLDQYVIIQYQNVENVRHAEDLIFLFIRPGTQALQTSLNQCDYHFNFVRINGGVILEIIKPFFKYPLAMEVDYPQINLTPII